MDINKLSPSVKKSILARLGGDEADEMKRARILKEMSMMSQFEALDAFLSWHGIIGYTQMITGAMTDIKVACGERGVNNNECA